MPLSRKITVVMSQDIGPPMCEAVGVTRTLKFDDHSPTLQNPETFHRVSHGAVVACHGALH